jgi:hypothetical protein
MPTAPLMNVPAPRDTEEARLRGLNSQTRMAWGTQALDGSNPTPVVTGLNSVASFQASLRGAVAPGLGTSVLTQGAPSGGTVDVYAWMPTSATNPTLIASTGTETFEWIAIGT